MAFFRRRPLTVEAVLVGDVLYEEDRHVLPAWVHDGFEQHFLRIGRGPMNEDLLKIYTLNGWVSADASEWLMRGVKGELYPCDPEVFTATYEPATEVFYARLEGAGGES